MKHRAVILRHPTSTYKVDDESVQFVLNFSKEKKRKQKKARDSGVHLRGTMLILKEIIDLLSSEQKSVVHAMALSPILEMKFTKIPTFLALKVLQSFYLDTLNLSTKCGVVHIDEYDVHNVFGFDLNGEDLVIAKLKKGPLLEKSDFLSINLAKGN
ncbi:hypothetical protein QQ045_030666 [Rhodiola kirilowii]